MSLIKPLLQKALGENYGLFSLFNLLEEVMEFRL